MAYQVQRTPRFTDELQLIANSGEVMMVIPVDIDINQSAPDIYKGYFDLIHAQQELKKLQTKGVTQETIEKQLEIIGETAISLYSLLFGKDNTSQMLSFFEDDYVEMMEQTFPYLVDVIIPAIRKLSEARKKAIISRKRKNLWRH